MAFASFLDHYLNYITSPTILLTALLLLIPLTLELFTRYKPASPTIRVPGCSRLGLYHRSNLSDQYERTTGRRNTLGQDSITGSPRIKALFTYPIKSCRGVELAASEVGSTGLNYDRLFTFAQLVSTPPRTQEGTDSGMDDVSTDPKHEWHFMTQRELPRLALLKTELWLPKPPPAAAMQGNERPADNSATLLDRKRGRRESRDDEQIQVKTARSKVTTSDWVANGGCVVLTFPFEPDFNPLGLRTETVTICIPLSPPPQRAESKGYTHEPVKIWLDNPTALNMTSEIPADSLAKLRHFLRAENPLALFRISPSNPRPVTRNLPQGRHSVSPPSLSPDQTAYPIAFADAFPIHLLNLASVRALDASQPPTATTTKDTLDARRFRANVYITGAPAFAEDSWKRINMGRSFDTRRNARRDLSPGGGGANPSSSRPGSREGLVGGEARVEQDQDELVETDGEYHVACRTARCTVPNVDPRTGTKDVKGEPYATLGRTRRVDPGAYPHPCLGMHVIPLFGGRRGLVRVGDQVEVVKRGEHVYEKMFK